MCRTVNWLCWLTINLVINKISVLGQYNVPVNSCPQYFEYVNNGNDIEGQIKLKFRITESLVKIVFEASVATRLISNYVGAIELINSKNTVALDIRDGRPLLYRVKFPLRDVIPQVTAIYYNDHLLCSGPASQGTYTNIRLNYLLDARGAGLNPNVNFVDRQPAPPPPQQTQYFTQPPQTHYNTQPSQTQHHTHVPQYHGNHVDVDETVPLFGSSQQTTPSQTFVTRKTRRPATASPGVGFFNPSDDSVCGASVSATTALIKGGSTFQKGEWPWLTAMFYEDEFICGGSIISSKHILSAAHCIQDKQTIRKDEKEAYITVGAFNLNLVEETEQKIFVSKFVVNPDWNPNEPKYDADISIIVLKTMIKYTKYIRPICLPTVQEATEDIANRQGVVAGWGKTETGNDRSNVPKIVSIPIVSEATCLRSDEFYYHVTTPRTFCAGGEDGQGPCNGDSGGGLMVKNTRGKWMVRGIVSAAQKDVGGDCDTYKFIVFTDTGKFISWIRSTMNS